MASTGTYLEGKSEEKKPTKWELRQLKKQRKLAEQRRELRKRKLKKVAYTMFLLLGGGGVGAGLIWFLAGSSPPIPEEEIVSKQGIHWHAELSISIHGQKQEIPAGIGLGFREQPIHTHEADGVVHLEFNGLVKKEDIVLGRFFEVWGKQLSPDCIFEYCSGTDGQLRMFVNGKENFEFADYMIRDGDFIELIFE